MSYEQNRSTGPRTDAGKAKASHNSFKHGLASGQILITGEDPDQFESLLAGFFEDFEPKTTIESALVHDLTKFRWLTDRSIRLQNEAFANEAPSFPSKWTSSCATKTPTSAPSNNPLSTTRQFKRNIRPLKGSPLRKISKTNK